MPFTIFVRLPFYKTLFFHVVNLQIHEKESAGVGALGWEFECFSMNAKTTMTISSTFAILTQTSLTQLSSHAMCGRRANSSKAASIAAVHAVSGCAAEIKNRMIGRKILF